MSEQEPPTTPTTPPTVATWIADPPPPPWSVIPVKPGSYVDWMRKNLSSLADFEFEGNLLKMRLELGHWEKRNTLKLMQLRRELRKRKTFGPDNFSVRPQPIRGKKEREAAGLPPRPKRPRVKKSKAPPAPAAAVPARRVTAA